MTTVKDLTSKELILFRKKMIPVFDGHSGSVKAEAGIVLSMIEEELSARGIKTFEEEPMPLNKTVLAALNRFKTLLQRPSLNLSKSS